MDHALIDLITAKIRAAEAEGQFDDLPGAGKPLPACDDPENAVMNRILKENGGVPEFVSLSRELARLREELRETGDRTRRAEIVKEMSLTEAKIEIARRRG
ncbi:DnaJ family domain-containing protein [Vannielia sp. SX4]|uniref:DnaJ family domain-containing protein n=1 Tax=Vannielia sp. SX4 TaxID=3463852 RepID=UPI0040594EED